MPSVCADIDQNVHSLRSIPFFTRDTFDYMIPHSLIHKAAQVQVQQTLQPMGLVACSKGQSTPDPNWIRPEFPSELSANGDKALAQFILQFVWTPLYRAFEAHL